MSDGFAAASMPPRPEDAVPAQPVAEPPSTADVVRDQAADLGGSTVQAGKHTADVAREQAAAVAAEAGRQGRDLLYQAQEQVAGQASRGQQRLASELTSLSDALGATADRSGSGGMTAELARQAARRAGDAGRWLGERTPEQLLDEIQRFARRRPGVFLALAAGAGLAAGRLARGMKAAAGDAGPGPAADPGTAQPGGPWAQATQEAAAQPESAGELTPDPAAPQADGPAGDVTGSAALPDERGPVPDPGQASPEGTL
jgi:hypothetical protein